MGAEAAVAAAAGDYWLKVRRVVLSLSHHPRTRLQITLLPHCTLCTIHSVHFAHFTVHTLHSAQCTLHSAPGKKGFELLHLQSVLCLMGHLANWAAGRRNWGRWDSSPQIQKCISDGCRKWNELDGITGRGEVKIQIKNSIGWRIGEC